MIKVRLKEANYLSTPQSAQPPTLEASGVLFQHRKDVALSESKLVRGFRYIVVQGPRFHAFLLKRKISVVS